MKKIFTLLFAASLFTLAQAQPGSRDNRDNRDSRDSRDNRDSRQPGPWDNPLPAPPDDRRFDDEREFTGKDFHFDRDDHYGNSRFSNERKRDLLIARINREYDFRFQRVMNSYYLNRWEKQRKIRFLQEQRYREIRMVYARFSNRNPYYGRDNWEDGPGRRY